MTLDDLFARIADVKVRCQPVDPSQLTSVEIEDIDNRIAQELADRFDEAKAEEAAAHRRSIRSVEPAGERRDPDAQVGAEAHDEHPPGYGHGH